MVIYLGLMLLLDSSCRPNLALHQVEFTTKHPVARSRVMKHDAEGISRTQHQTPWHFSPLTPQTRGLYCLCGTGPLLISQSKGWVLPITALFRDCGIGVRTFLPGVKPGRPSDLLRQKQYYHKIFTLSTPHLLDIALRALDNLVKIFYQY